MVLKFDPNYKPPKDVMISSNKLLWYIANVQYVATDYDGKPTLSAYEALEWVFQEILEMRKQSDDEKTERGRDDECE